MFKALPCAGLILNAIVGDLAEDAVNLGAQLALAVCGCCRGGGLISGGVLLPNLLALRRRRRGPPLLLLPPLLLQTDAGAAAGATPLVAITVARVVVAPSAASRIGLRARGQTVVEVCDYAVEEVDA